MRFKRLGVVALVALVFCVGYGVAGYFAVTDRSEDIRFATVPALVLFVIMIATQGLLSAFCIKLSSSIATHVTTNMICWLVFPSLVHILVNGISESVALHFILTTSFVVMLMIQAFVVSLSNPLIRNDSTNFGLVHLFFAVTGVAIFLGFNEFDKSLFNCSLLGALFGLVTVSAVLINGSPRSLILGVLLFTASAVLAFCLPRILGDGFIWNSKHVLALSVSAGALIATSFWLIQNFGLKKYLDDEKIGG